MSDPFDVLRHRDPEELPVDRLPADEVRRRGDARRRRRTALQGAAATLAVAAVVGGVAFGTGVVDRTAPEPPPASQGPSPTPSDEPQPSPTQAVDPDVVTAIPADFPLAAGYPEVTGVDEELQGPAPDVETFGGVSACDRALVDAAEPTARLATTFAQPEDYRARQLTTYASQADAVAQLDAFVSLHQACPRETWPDSPDTVIDVAPGTVGDASWTIARTYEMDGSFVPGIEVVVAARVGNAILFSSESNEGGGDASAVRQSRRMGERAVAPVLDAMCVFAADGCPPPRATTEALLTLDDVQEVTGFTTTWAPVEHELEGDCRERVPLTVLDDGGVATAFEGHGKDDPDVRNAQVSSAVARYASDEEAAEAYATAVQQAGGCRDDREQLSEGGEDGTTYWRLLSAPAPEVCTQCGAAWLHGTGVALVGDRVVAVNVSWIGDLEMVAGSDDPAPLPQLLDRAAERAPEE